MRVTVILIYILCQGFFAFAQKGKKDIHEGNQLYQQKKYAEAEANYRQSLEKSKTSVKGNFNLGDALYKQNKFDGAAQKFNDIATSSANKAVKAKAYHNLGNALLESKKLEESIAAYKKSLINNPKDDETRYNLAYAQEKLKEQQKQQNKNNQDKNDQNKQNKDQNDQNQKDQDQNKDQKKDQQDQNKQQNNQDKKDDQKGEKPQPNKLSKEDAERMLDALNQEEKNTQEKLKNKKAKGVKGHITKDW